MICELEVVVAEAPRPGRAGTPGGRARTDADGVELLHHRAGRLGASSGSIGTSRARSSMVRSGVFSPFVALDALEIEEAVVVEVADDELGEAAARRR